MTPAYFHLGGDVFGSDKTPLSQAGIEEALDLALRESDACLRIGDRLGSRTARKAFLDLTEAVDQRNRWKRCMDQTIPCRELDQAIRAMSTPVLTQMLGDAA